MKFLIQTICLTLVFIACQRPINLKIKKTTETATVVKGNRFEGVIFSDVKESYLYEDTIKHLKPTLEEVIIAEQILNESIESALNHKPRFSKNHYAKLNNFDRQYVGIIWNNEKIVHIYFISNKIIRQLPITDEELYKSVI